MWYLDQLANKLYHLPLRGLEERLNQGKGVALPPLQTSPAFARPGA